MHKYSPEDLLLYLYKETSLEQTAAMDEAIRNDWALREKFLVMQKAKERLDNMISSPRAESVINILNYASRQQKITS
jgi:hypothetical protein